VRELPFALHALAGQRSFLTRCLDALDEPRPAVERADLARVTAILAARYENVLADAFYPQIADALGKRSGVERAKVRLARARGAIGAVRADLRGVAPIDAHASDPQEVEEHIDAMARSVRELMQFEDSDLFRLVGLLSPNELDRLRRAIEGACAHQTSLPEPPANALIRKVAEIKEMVSLFFIDQSTPWLPGMDALIGQSVGMGRYSPR
jgi:hypothetical protein